MRGGGAGSVQLGFFQFLHAWLLSEIPSELPRPILLCVCVEHTPQFSCLERNWVAGRPVEPPAEGISMKARLPMRRMLLALALLPSGNMKPVIYCLQGHMLSFILKEEAILPVRS